MLVDSHAHLDAPQLYPELEAVLERADQVGVKWILSIGCLKEPGTEWERYLGLLQYPGVLGAAGVHPHDARHYNTRLGEQLAELMSHPRMLGWGEIGLDFHYQHSPPGRQEEAFRAQLRLAREVAAPVILHCREAEEDLIRILEEEFAPGPGGILHCFTGSLQGALRCVELGFYVAFGGILTFPKAEDLRRTAARLPRERVLIETDSPYLAPVPFRGKRNEPAWVVQVARTLADLWGEELETVGRITTENFQRLFPDKLPST